MIPEMSERSTKLRARVQELMDEHIMPNESLYYQQIEEADDRWGCPPILDELKAKAKAAGLWNLFLPESDKGAGLTNLEYAPISEVMGRVHFGSEVFNCSAPDTGNMEVLERYATEENKERWLTPLLNGEIRSAFAMTEPAVASSDATNIESSIVKDGDEYVINGRKWFTTGAARAAYTTVMCRTEVDVPSHGAFSMIIVPTNNSGYEIVRETPVLGIEGGHYEVSYNNVRVPKENLLGPRGQGFLIAQRRLGPGRIFHCMRWLGQAQRAFDLMCLRLHERNAFGSSLADKQLMQKFVFDSACEIQSSRQLTLDAAKRIDQGDDARIEIGMIKVVGANMLHNVIDRAIQVHGAKGLTDDTPLSQMYRHAREARIYDGPDEVHVHSVAKRILKNYQDNGAGWDFGERDASLNS